MCVHMNDVGLHVLRDMCAGQRTSECWSVSAIPLEIESLYCLVMCIPG